MRKDVTCVGERIVEITNKQNGGKEGVVRLLKTGRIDVEGETAIVQLVEETEGGLGCSIAEVLPRTSIEEGLIDEVLTGIFTTGGEGDNQSRAKTNSLILSVGHFVYIL